MGVRVGPWRKLSAEQLMLLNCGVGRILLRVPWTARRSNQSILIEMSPEYPLEGLMLKLTPILWPPDVKSWLIWKDPDAGKDCKWEEKGMTENEKLGGHHWFNGYEFEQAPGVGDGVLQSMGSHDWETELNWNFLSNTCSYDWHSVCVVCVCACTRACVQTVRQHLQLCRGTWRQLYLKILNGSSWGDMENGFWRAALLLR